jgi:hypothetical protein
VKRDYDYTDYDDVRRFALEVAGAGERVQVGRGDPGYVT